VSHTPGPWQSDGIGRVIAVGAHKGIHGAWQRDICSLRERTNDLGTAAADTALIAAAPDLLAASADFLQWFETFIGKPTLSDIECSELTALRTAISKAVAS
jgi:hypothetical protein